MKSTALFLILAFAMSVLAVGQPVPGPLAAHLEERCLECHDQDTAKGGLNLTSQSFDLTDAAIRQRWIRIHDRIDKGEMPPKAKDLPTAERASMLQLLSTAIYSADHADVVTNGRGPLRRLNRDEYENNLRDLLHLPDLDIRSRLPEDRKQDGFNKSAQALDLSHVQMAAYLDAADAALREAMASGAQPPVISHYHALATQMFPSAETFGGTEAMFYALHSKMISMSNADLQKIRQTHQHNPEVEMALFRSASWPYFGYPEAFVAKTAGEYRVRFSARSVRQVRDFRLVPAPDCQPMTFRARAPSGADVSGDVRATGGWIDVQPAGGVYETTVRLAKGQTLEYSLLGLPIPLPITKNGGPLYYDFPPMPEGGHPGVAFRWIDIEGPIAPQEWPPASHRVLFGALPIRDIPGAKPAHALPIQIVSPHAKEDAIRLLDQFARTAARQPVPRSALLIYEQLILDQMEAGQPFAEAMLAGYKAFLCSGHFLYLREPTNVADHDAIASRLSHFLWNTRPDAQLETRSHHQELRDATVLRQEADRLIDHPRFADFVSSFTDYWLDLKDLHRDDPDIRLYPEYRMDDYLIESMGHESRAFFATMIRDNLPASTLVTSDFVCVNDRLARHYGIPGVSGSAIRRVPLPKDSPYGGILTQAAVLRVTTNGTTTSPVIRGAWIMTRLLGDPPPPPPPTVPAVEPDIRGAKTIREILALHTKSASCAACHARFDPVGLALENFDIMGGWRDRYRGLEQGLHVTGIDRTGFDYNYTVAEPVDASGKLLDGRTFQGIQDLKTMLAADPRPLARNLLRQFITYATSSPVRYSDRAEIEAILDHCRASNYGVRDLVRGLVVSKIFVGEAGTQPETATR